MKSPDWSTIFDARINVLAKGSHDTSTPRRVSFAVAATLLTLNLGFVEGGLFILAMTGAEIWTCSPRSR